MLSRRRRIGDNGGPPLSTELPPQPLGTLVAPGGVSRGVNARRARSNIWTVTPEEMAEIVAHRTYNGRELSFPGNYNGVWYEGADRCIIGIRFSFSSGLTLDVRDGGASDWLTNYEFHVK